MNQLGFPSPVTYQELAREKTLGGAIDLCARASGLEPKQIIDALCKAGLVSKTDKAQWSRWVSGGEGIVWEKLQVVMDECGNDAPILWMLLRRGYDMRSLRKRETELEQKLREAQEALAHSEMKNRVLVVALSGRAA
jgi:hypothetical protein